MRVAFVSNYVPRIGDGSSAHVLALLSYLKQSGCLVTYICTNDRLHGRIPWYATDRHLKPLAKLLAWRNMRLWNVYIRPRPLKDWPFVPVALIYAVLPASVRRWYRRTIKSRLPQRVPRGPDVVPVDALRFAARQVLRIRPDVVIADYVWMATVLDAIGPEALKVIFTHDVLHQRVSSLKAHGISEGMGAWTRDREAGLLAKADLLLAVQSEDAKALQEMVPVCEVMTLPMPVVPQAWGTTQVRGRCLFVGNAALQNVHGLDWFLCEVWPQVLASAPWAELHVCGGVCESFGGAFPGVRFLGRVDDLSPEYSAAEVCVVPNLVGSGLKIKLVEALSYGRACVSTSVGLQGVMELADTAVALADTPEEFASAVCQVLQDSTKRQDMEKETRTYVRERLSPEAVCQPLVDRFHQHVTSRRHHPDGVPAPRSH